MANPWKHKVQAFLTRVNSSRAKSGDMDIIVAALVKLPPGQLKKVLSEDVLNVLKKYGYSE